MNVSTRIYAGGALAFGGQPAIDDLKSAGYTTVLVWSLHVQSSGDLVLNDTQIVTGGIYQEAQPMDLPSRLAQLHAAGVEILFSVGAGGTQDFTNIAALLNGGIPGPGNALYDNFKALKDAMVIAGGDIDGIDFDNEDNMDTSVMVNFGRMLHNAGYAHVTLCPYYSSSVWTDTLRQLTQDPGVGFVNAIHLQCYSGGQQNAQPGIVEDWQQTIAQAGSAGACLLIPGLATNQTAPGPWWYQNVPGGSVVRTTGVAMYGQADWSGYLRTENYPSADAALQGAQSRGGANFFFYCNGALDLGPGRQFQPGDAVFFSGEPWWGSAPQCDAYALSGGCSNIYNTAGACPADLQTQYQTWATIETPPQGGFIWLYDSVMECLLSGCCGGTEKASTTTARAYRDAISNGLSADR